MVDRLLVIDDSTTIQKVVQLAFAKLDLDVSFASSFLEATNEVNSRPPNVVIADSTLPGMKGPEDYSNLRRKLGSTPFIILIGSYDGVSEDGFRSYGFDHFLRKPFEASDLVNCVELAVGHSLVKRSDQRAVSSDGLQKVSGEPPGPPPPPPLRLEESAQAKAPKPAVPSSSPRDADPLSISLGDDDDEDLQGLLPHAEPEEKQATAAADTTEETDKAKESTADGAVGPELQSSESTEAEPKKIDFASTDAPDASPPGVGRDDAPDSFEFTNPGFSVPKSAAPANQYVPVGNFDENDDDLDDWNDQDGFMPPPPPPEESEPPRSSSVSVPPGTPAPNPYEEQWKPISAENQSDTITEPSASESREDAAPRLDKEQVQGLLEPLLREEVARLVKESVFEYCDRHFSRLARDILTAEIEKLMNSKSRLLIDK